MLSQVDMVVADPPYVISRESTFHRLKDRKNPRTGTMFGEWDLSFDNEPWIAAVSQCLKPGGSLVVFNDWTKATTIVDLCRKVGLVYKDTLCFCKTNPFPRNRDRRYSPNTEMIQWYVKPGKWTFNRGHPSYESSVLSYASESGGGFKRYHPTQKPVRLIEHLIRIHTNPGELVVDPFMGSGTTAIACQKIDRHFIGFEINKEYYTKSQERLEELSHAKREKGVSGNQTSHEEGRKSECT